jgi:hypothetical protein
VALSAVGVAGPGGVLVLVLVVVDGRTTVVVVAAMCGAIVVATGTVGLATTTLCRTTSLDASPPMQ